MSSAWDQATWAQAGAARAAAPGAARLLAPSAAALLLRPSLVVGAAAVRSSSSDGPPPPEDEEQEEEEHVVIWDLAPAVADRQKGDMYRMGDVVKRWDGGTSRTMCRDCLPEKAVQAEYKDEDGIKQLCGPHARAAGTHAVHNPCRDCPEDAKLQAAYNDEDGKTNQLCATHARAVGSWAKQH